MKLPLALILVLLAPVLAGCTNHASKPTPTSTSTTPGPTATSTSTSLPPGPPISAINNTVPKIQLSQCTAFDAAVGPFPRGLGPGNAPPGWEPKDPAAAISYVSMVGYECNRISIGPFERGPIRIVTDGHDKADIPLACKATVKGGSHQAILNTFLVNDSMVADYLAATYGLPATYAQIQNQAQAAGALVQHAWTWTPPGLSASTVMIFDDGQAQSNDISDRFYWQRGAGIGILDFVYTRQGPTFTNRAAYGTMQPPMLLASQPQGLFISSSADYYPSLSGEGIIRLYKDAQCQQAESSS